MTLRSAFSKLLSIISRLWGIDTTIITGRYGGSDEFAARLPDDLAYMRGRAKIPVSRTRAPRE
ncbi:hypothetical protein SAZ10_15405 [Mesorhizobium sp. BAC0120]|uniref:hypothetical protein n=1 Tax=Mesorhizobium sp. BAC0120 TaxID=3090670 RepID=UPI00298CEB33|nr:hypothetical protein [Mesorhizobium sp. BAC0120]MDW6023147.1 hypothetical protein [Mesorhizobium sp. BAC0120]